MGYVEFSRDRIVTQLTNSDTRSVTQTWLDFKTKRLHCGNGRVKLSGGQVWVQTRKVNYV